MSTTDPTAGAAEQRPSWGTDAAGAWHRLTGTPASADDRRAAANTLCGDVLDPPRETATDPPGAGAARCRRCEVIGEAVPPNH